MSLRGLCPLCKTQGELRDSHIIPQSFFRWIAGGDGTIVALHGEQGRDEVSARGFSQPLLCPRCEGRHADFDTYLHGRLVLGHGRREEISHEEFQFTQLAEQKKVKLKKSVLALFLRAHYATIHPFEGFSISSDFVACIERFLLADNWIDDPNAFVLLAQYDFRFGVMMPIQNTLEGIDVYECLLGEWLLVCGHKVGQEIPEYVEQLSINSDADIPLLPLEIAEGQLLEEIFETMRSGNPKLAAFRFVHGDRPFRMTYYVSHQFVQS